MSKDKEHKTICCYCGVHLRGPKDEPEFDAQGRPNWSHGCCQTCYDQQMEEIRKMGKGPKKNSGNLLNARRNCCLTLKQNDFPTIWRVIREHQELEKKLKNFRVALEHFYVSGVESFLDFMEKKYPIHSAKEEQVVFLMLARVLPVDDPNLPHLLKEHAKDRTLVARLQDLLLLHYTDKTNRDCIEDIIKTGVELYCDLCDHSEHENSKVFPLVETHLSDEEKEYLKKRLDEIGYFC